MTWAEELFAQALTIDDEVKAKRAELESLEEKRDLIKSALAKISRAMGSQRFKVAYAHLIKGLSLNECAKRYHYTRAGVSKICACFRKKLEAIEKKGD